MAEYNIRLGAMDLVYWYGHHGVCPNCGINLRAMHPAMNVYPHWSGACKDPAPEPAPQNQFTMTWKQKLMRLIDLARG